MKLLGVVLLLAAAALCDNAPSPAARARTILDQGLNDGNPDVRKQATLSLSLCGAREPYFNELESMLKDSDMQVRLAAVSSLTDMRGRRARAALRKVLDDPTPEVSFAAARALWTLHDPEGERALLAVLSGERKTASSFFTRQKRDALRMMHTPKTMLLFAVRQGVGFAPVPGLGEGIASMQGLLSDPDVSGRALAALLLGSDHAPETVHALRDALADKEWSVRAAAAQSLALRNDPSLMPALESLLSDAKQEVRLRAAAGYLRLETVRLSPVRQARCSGRRASRVE